MEICLVNRIVKKCVMFVIIFLWHGGHVTTTKPMIITIISRLESGPEYDYN